MPDQTPVPVVPAAELSRRVVVLGGCAAAAVCLAGCAGYGETDSAAPASDPSPAPDPAPAGGAPAADPGIVAASEVPVGGGVILADRELVVTQPQAGTFAAFGTTCPHQGCSVNEVADGTINCPCHGSRFRLRDGSVAKGPAKKGLPARPVRAVDGRILLA